MSESEWTVRVAVDAIRAGQRFIFAEEFGGEGQVVTAEGGATNLMGTRVLNVEEEDFPLEFYGNPMVTLAASEEVDQ